MKYSEMNIRQIIDAYDLPPILLRLYAIDCARFVVHLNKDPKSIGDALDVCEKYFKGIDTRENFLKAKETIDAAYAAAYAAYAANAAYAAAYAAANAANAAYAAANAAYAVANAAYAAAEKEMETKCKNHLISKIQALTALEQIIFRKNV